MSLRERREVLSLFRAAEKPEGVLFSVVRVSGSSYRQPGARMLAMADGGTAGTLSGGCLEADVLRRAAWTVRAGAVVERFSTAFDDTAEIPYGLGCGGEVDLLAEPLNTPEAAALLAAMEDTLQRRERQVATLLPSDATRQALRRVVLDSDGDVLFASEALPTEVVVRVRQLVRSAAMSEPCRWTETPLGTLFVERLLPVQRLLIFGGGEDSRPLARLAAEMGWHTVVVDTRANRTTAERFPSSECVVASTTKDVPVYPEDAAVLMTHSYRQDRQLLAELLPDAPVYLGLLGARHRSALLLHEASAMTGVSLQDAVGRVYAPVGLRLGGEGPEAVALAIVAQVQQVLAGLHAHSSVSRQLNLADVEKLLAEGPFTAEVYEGCALGVRDATVNSQAVAH